MRVLSNCENILIFSQCAMKYSPTSPTSPPLYACAITSQSFKDSDQSSCPFTIAYARTLQVLERSKKKQQSGQLMKSWLIITVSYALSKVLLSGHGARKKPQKHQIYPQLPFHKSFSKSSPTALALPRVLLPTCHEA